MSQRHLCPVWVGYLLANPIRTLFQNPEKILGPHLTAGMWVLDIGSAMGFFSLPAARLVGPIGRVVCVDLQQKMLDALLRRASRVQLRGRIEARVCGSECLGIADLHDRIDMALLIAVIHEIADPSRCFAEVHDSLRAGGHVLFAEPRGHVAEETFGASLAAAERAGLRKIGSLRIPWSRAALLEKGGCLEPDGERIGSWGGRAEGVAGVAAPGKAGPCPRTLVGGLQPEPGLRGTPMPVIP